MARFLAHQNAPFRTGRQGRATHPAETKAASAIRTRRFCARRFLPYASIQVRASVGPLDVLELAGFCPTGRRRNVSLSSGSQATTSGAVELFTRVAFSPWGATQDYATRGARERTKAMPPWA